MREITWPNWWQIPAYRHYQIQSYFFFLFFLFLFLFCSCDARHNARDFVHAAVHAFWAHWPQFSHTHTHTSPVVRFRDRPPSQRVYTSPRWPQEPADFSKFSLTELASCTNNFWLNDPFMVIFSSVWLLGYDLGSQWVACLERNDVRVTTRSYSFVRY